ncbi:MAG: hypothetical protein ACTSU5_21150 [Promethearchaeota archaeon]
METKEDGRQAAPVFASGVYIRAQVGFTKLKPGKHDYRVLVLDSAMITVGINLFNKFYTGPALTSFSGDTFSTWLFAFEFYCILPIIGTFILSSVIVPSSWLLDDCGVVYFEENLKYRSPADVSRISEWFLKYIKAVAGFTAIVAYVGIFINVNPQGAFRDDPAMILFGTINIYVLIVGFPFVGGVIYMLVAQIAVEKQLPVLREKLYRRLERKGIDTTPRQLREMFPPSERAPVVFNGLKHAERDAEKDGKEQEARNESA